MRNAKSLGLIALASLTLLTGCQAVPWNYSYDLAMQSAARQRKRVVVLFATASSPECREMDWTVFTDAKVREMMREFVPVRQDFFVNRPEADKLGVTQVPTLVVLRPDGTVAGTHVGKLSPEDLRFFLIKNRFN
ncbi:MAG TPA: thioredoxin family protein [Phycisphaerae bacterium]|nr:thioredoxin family protein [Phycisphaerae bacterium]HOJ75174.1 thioredoxin family protein [Phycisphaerae bacterium]HOM52475.1 thioredoxin family protein [Phycisphaerae bacterium]HOQ85932.1 thioredoxin family protein [Phycisphaerae bacterium]HPP27749.1 thioredoxin family protein [Phycisphaerae bacterium]